MSDQDHLLDSVSDVSSQGEDHLLDLLIPFQEPMEQEEATFRGIRQPRMAYSGRDLYFRGDPSNPLVMGVSIPRRGTSRP